MWNLGTQAALGVGTQRGKKCSDMKSWGAVGYVEAAAQQRAARYRDRAAVLRDMAREEPIGPLRSRLLDLAHKYQEVAASLEKNNPRSVARRPLSLNHPHRMKG